MSTTNGVRLSGKGKGWPHWTTPKSVLDVVREVGPIHLDPCSNEASQVFALRNWQSEGLILEWAPIAAGGLAFVNPPYSLTKAFVEKVILEAALGTEVILLVAARTDTQWAHKALRSADSLCFWEGRIRFENPPPDSLGDAPSIPSAFYYWGRNHRLFMKTLQPHGFCIDLRRNRERRTFPVEAQP